MQLAQRPLPLLLLFVPAGAVAAGAAAIKSVTSSPRGGGAKWPRAEASAPAALCDHIAPAVWPNWISLSLFLSPAAVVLLAAAMPDLLRTLLAKYLWPCHLPPLPFHCALCSLSLSLSPAG
jgi:hypothetical protein